MAGRQIFDAEEAGGGGEGEEVDAAEEGGGEGEEEKGGGECGVRHEGWDSGEWRVVRRMRGLKAVLLRLWSLCKVVDWAGEDPHGKRR